MPLSSQDAVRGNARFPAPRVAVSWRAQPDAHRQSVLRRPAAATQPAPPSYPGHAPAPVHAPTATAKIGRGRLQLRHRVVPISRQTVPALPADCRYAMPALPATAVPRGSRVPALPSGAPLPMPFAASWRTRKSSGRARRCVDPGSVAQPPDSWLRKHPVGRAARQSRRAIHRTTETQSVPPAEPAALQIPVRPQ